MKPHPILVFITATFVCLQGTFADRMIWPKQPKLSLAYDALIVALKQVEKSHEGDSATLLQRASAQLLVAKTNLETAKKNKGSARLAAIEQIDIAESKLAAGRPGEASASISKAIEQVTRAAQNGR